MTCEWLPIDKYEPDQPHILVTIKWDEYDYEVCGIDYWMEQYGAKEMHDKRSIDILDHTIAWMHYPAPYKPPEEECVQGLQVASPKNEDLISRQDAIDALSEQFEIQNEYVRLFDGMSYAISVIKDLPPSQPEVKPISYTDCANAMLMMWMDEVLTDGEYNRIMDKLNAFEMERRKND